MLDIRTHAAPTGGRAEAIEIDRQLREHARMRARSDYELGALLRRGWLLQVHDLGGFGSFREYAEQLFGFTGRQTEERLRVAEVLEALPLLNRAFSNGDHCWSVIRELTRVCTQDNE